MKFIMKWHTKSCWSNFSYQHRPVEGPPDKASSSWQRPERLLQLFKGPPGSSALSSRDRTWHCGVICSLSLHELCKTKKYSRNVESTHKSSFRLFSISILLNPLWKDTLLSPPSLRSHLDVWRPTHSLFLYHKWKHLLILNLKQFLPQSILCCRRDPFMLQKQNSWAHTDKCKKTQYLMFKYTKCALGCKCLRKKKERANLESQQYDTAGRISNWQRKGTTPFRTVSSGQNYPKQTLFWHNLNFWQKLNALGNK